MKLGNNGTIISVDEFFFPTLLSLKFLESKEVFVDPSRDESLIFELLDLKLDVGDNGSAAWFLQDLATEQDAEGCTVN